MRNYPVFQVFAVILCMACGSCSFVNIFKGEADYQHHYHAAELKWTIDYSVAAEAAKEPPSGWKTKHYQPSQWDEYWNSRIFYIGSGNFHEAYRGPSKEEWVRYIIRSREEASLRKLPIEPRNKKIVEQAGVSNGG